MDYIQGFLMPLAVAFATAIITAFVSIHIKFSGTKEEALKGLKSMARTALYYFWAGYLIFLLYSEITSAKPLTRASVFAIAVYLTSLSLILVFRFLLRILSIMEKHSSLHHKHIDLYEGHILNLHPETSDAEKKSTNK